MTSAPGQGLNAMIGEKEYNMIGRIRQELVLSDCRVSGFFRHRNVLQLIPAPKKAPILQSIVGHHPCLLEFKYTVRDPSETQFNPALPNIEGTIDYDDSKKSRREVLLLLSAFTKNRVFQYEHSGLGGHKWFVAFAKGPGDTLGVGKLYWGLEGYSFEGFRPSVVEDFTNTGVPPISLVERNRYFSTDRPGVFVIGQTSETFDLPDNIHALFDNYYALTEEAQKAFLSSCFLLNKSMELAESAPSLAFAACVSAIETLSAFDHRDEKVRTCHWCRQQKYYPTRKFRDFIAANGSDSAEYRKLANKVYRLRSGILHRGQLTFGEIEPKTIENALEWVGEAEFRRNVVSFFRICLINWLIKTQTKRTQNNP